MNWTHETIKDLNQYGDLYKLHCPKCGRNLKVKIRYSSFYLIWYVDVFCVKSLLFFRENKHIYVSSFSLWLNEAVNGTVNAAFNNGAYVDKEQ